MANLNTYGEIAYMAYREAVGGGVYNGGLLPEYMPSWEEMLADGGGGRTIAAWEHAGKAAARAAINEVFQSVLEEEEQLAKA